MKLVDLGALGYALVYFCMWPSKIAATRLVNRTIDDQHGDSVTGLQPIYFPSEGVWYTQTCDSPRCAIAPSPTRAFNQTYTAGIYRPAVGPMGISMQFNGRPRKICSFRYPDRHSTGTAIYVFFILVNFYKGDGIPILTSANFTVDGDVPVPFTHVISDPSASSVEYRVLVFSKTGLTSTLHTLNISTTGSATAYVNFDYAIYR